jgi:IMP cyclohydrolase
LLSNNTYPGRGIIVGKSADGKSAMIAYFIMGRSVNSRNRIFERYEGGMRTKAFDESKLVDPSLIIYNPYLSCGNSDVVTNGDQTDTVVDYIKKNGDDGFSFDKALYTREFEPDSPNFTPRISAILNYDFDKNSFDYRMSILKSSDGNPEVCEKD